MLDDLIITVGNKGGDKHEFGTWFHPKLAIVFARWLSTEFEIWCDEKIEELLREGSIKEPETAEETNDLRCAIDIVAFIKGPYEEQLADLKKRTETSDRTFTKKAACLISGLAVHSACSKFPEMLTKISISCTFAEREPMYGKVRNAIRDLYESHDKCVQITRNDYEYLMNVVTIRERALISSRLTKKNKEVAMLRSTIDELAQKVETYSSDIALFEKKVQGTGSVEDQNKLLQTEELLNDAVDQIKSLQAAAGLITDATVDMPIETMTGTTVREAIHSIKPLLEKEEYNIIFCQGLISNKWKKDGDKLPPFHGTAFNGPFSVGIWPHNDGTVFVKVTRPLDDPDGNPIPNTSFTCVSGDMRSIGDDCYGLINKSNDTVIVLHEPTNALVVYSKLGRK